MKKLIRKIERRTCGRDTANAVAALQTLYAADPVNAIVTFKEFADALKQEGTVGYQVIDALRA
ncbi:MAG TPA: hypothetical protein VFF26_01830, partial [Gallionella sp.]|nr:hypothetical protein [Gallionella sp.]